MATEPTAQRTPAPAKGAGASRPPFLAWFILGACVSVVLITALVAIGLRSTLRRATLDRADRDAERITTALTSTLGAALEGGVTPEEEARIREMMQAFGALRLRVFGPDGALLYTSDDSVVGRKPPLEDALGASMRGGASSVVAPAHVVWRTRPDPFYRKVLSATYVPVVAHPGAAKVSVEVCRDVTEEQDAQRQTFIRAVGVVFAALLIAFTALTAVMRRAQRTIVEGAAALGEARSRSRAEEALRAIVEGTAGAVGEGFFRSLVERLAGAFSVRYAFVGEVVDSDNGTPANIRVVALWSDRGPVETFEYAISGSPCEAVLQAGTRFYPSRVAELFPDNPRLAEMGVESYLGTPLHDADGRPIGLLGVLHDRPIEPEPHHESILRIFAARAGVELERGRAAAALERSRGQLRVAERLASIGALAAGIGHDLNNLLLPMRGQVRALLAETTPGGIPPEARRQIEALSQSIEFLRQLGENLRMLAESGEAEDGAAHGVTCIGSWWAQVGAMLSRAMPRRIALRVELPDDLPRVAVAPARLTQAVLNLFVNAADAVHDTPAPDVRLHARSGAGHVELSVTDNGKGMSPDTAKHAFDPFFTTKHRGASTGLGLALVQQVAAGAGGRAEILSEPGKGTTVTLRLATARAGAPLKRASRASVSIADERLAAYAAAMLASQGYHVTRTGPDDPGESDLWVLDPASNTPDAARRFLGERTSRRALTLGATSEAWRGAGVIELGELLDHESLRRALDDAGLQAATGDHA